MAVTLAKVQGRDIGKYGMCGNQITSILSGVYTCYRCDREHESEYSYVESIRPFPRIACAPGTVIYDCVKQFL